MNAFTSNPPWQTLSTAPYIANSLFWGRSNQIPHAVKSRECDHKQGFDPIKNNMNELGYTSPNMPLEGRLIAVR
jgi:hypothetical protein